MKFVIRLLSLLIFLLASACALVPGQGEETETPGALVEGVAQIDSIQLLILESFPVQVNAAITGTLPDSCTLLGETTVSRAENTFTIAVATTRPADAVCEQVITTFEQTVALDVVGLAAGEYLVIAGSNSAAFVLAVDNVIPDLTEPTPASTGAIEGRLWHDLCAVAGGEGGEPSVPSENCIEVDGAFAADGILTSDEPGIAGVEVKLLQGSCDGPVIGSIFTNEDGSFAFSGLAAGTYCVLIDPLANPNSGILIPGDWSSVAKGSAVIDLAEGQTLQALNFGWDYQFLPEPGSVPTAEPTPEPTATPGPNQADCTNKAEFVDETIEDDTVVAAGASFTKSWTLENAGTCRWETDYKLVFVSGDAMGGAVSTPLSVKVPVGEQITLSVDLTAPDVAGTYRGDWMIEDAAGNRFGLGSNGDKAFWVQVVVEGSVSNLNLGSADWTDNFSSGSNWYLYNSDAVRFSIEDDDLRMRAKIAGSGDYWILSNQPDLDDFYLEAEFKMGSSCSGLDRYGLLVRAPEANKGYVFNVSCNGQFRVYEWDGSNYNQLQGWTSAAAIQAGANASNKVGVWAEGDTLKLFINNILVAELDVDIYDEGQFGLLVGSTNTTNLDVFVERISYWHLDD